MEKKPHRKNNKKPKQSKIKEINSQLPHRANHNLISRLKCNSSRDKIHHQRCNSNSSICKDLIMECTDLNNSLNINKIMVLSILKILKMIIRAINIRTNSNNSISLMDNQLIIIWLRSIWMMRVSHMSKFDLKADKIYRFKYSLIH